MIEKAAKIKLCAYSRLMWETRGVQVPMKIPAELDGPRGDVGNRSPPQSFPKVSLSLVRAAIAVRGYSRARSLLSSPTTTLARLALGAARRTPVMI